MKRKEKHYRNIFFPGLILLIALYSCRQPAGQEDNAVHVREFGVLANSGEDAAEGILRAINYAQSNGIRKVLFDAGTYTFKNIPGREQGNHPADFFYIQLNDVQDLEMVGATDDKGEPVTLWLKHNDLKVSQPGILSIQGGGRRYRP